MFFFATEDRASLCAQTLDLEMWNFIAVFKLDQREWHLVSLAEPDACRSVRHGRLEKVPSSANPVPPSADPFDGHLADLFSAAAESAFLWDIASCEGSTIELRSEAAAGEQSSCSATVCVVPDIPVRHFTQVVDRSPRNSNLSSCCQHYTTR